MALDLTIWSRNDNIMRKAVIGQGKIRSGRGNTSKNNHIWFCFSLAWFFIERENVREAEIYSASWSDSTFLVAMSTASSYRKNRQPCRPNFPYVCASSQFHWMRLTDEGSIPRDSSRAHFDGGKIVIKPVYFDLGELKKK